MREDPFRVRFPDYTGGDEVATVKFSDVVKTGERLGMGVHPALVLGEEGLYVYKEIDRPLYVPPDSEVLEAELRNLQSLSGTPGIVRLVTPVVSENPYLTSKAAHNRPSCVLRGMLLEYHPNGTLKEALATPETMTSQLARWAVQITAALSRLHQAGLTHMDLKSQNIMLDKGRNAILIDLSGIGGITRAWLSPEMLASPDPILEDVELRAQNDIWALGKILSEIAEAMNDCTPKLALQNLSSRAMADLSSRISLQALLASLLALQV